MAVQAASNAGGSPTVDGEYVASEETGATVQVEIVAAKSEPATTQNAGTVTITGKSLGNSCGVGCVVLSPEDIRAMRDAASNAERAVRDNPAHDRKDRKTDSRDATTGKNASTKGTSCGNPVMVASGNKVEIDTDFVSESVGGLSLVRTYNLNAGVSGLFGPKWFTVYDLRAVYEGSNGAGGSATITLYRPDASSLVFDFDAAYAGWYLRGKVSRLGGITRLPDGRYLHRASGGGTEIYSWGGSVLSLANREGVTWTFQYTDPHRSVSAALPNATLQAVVHPVGVALHSAGRSWPTARRWSRPCTIPPAMSSPTATTPTGWPA